jgi:hypothetical protein
LVKYYVIHARASKTRYLEKFKINISTCRIQTKLSTRGHIHAIRPGVCVYCQSETHKSIACDQLTKVDDRRKDLAKNGLDLFQLHAR